MLCPGIQKDAALFLHFGGMYCTNQVAVGGAVGPTKRCAGQGDKAFSRSDGIIRQIPGPICVLSYSGFMENVASQDKVSNVKDNVKSVLDVINPEKEKQLKSEQVKLKW
jgi:hypothetical protein